MSDTSEADALFAGAHSPQTNAVLRAKLDAFAPFDFALRETHDILDDRLMRLLLRLARSGLVGLAWSAPPCKEFSRLKLRRPGPKALRTPEYMDGVPGLSPQSKPEWMLALKYTAGHEPCSEVSSAPQGRPD